MAEKIKKVENRDLAYERVASAIMQDSGIDKIRKHKEGLEYEFNGEVFAVRVIKKKADLDEKEFKGEFIFDGKEFGYKEYSAKDKKAKAV